MPKKTSASRVKNTTLHHGSNRKGFKLKVELDNGELLTLDLTNGQVEWFVRRATELYAQEHA